MNLFDLDLEELKLYKPYMTKDNGFDDFWSRRISESTAQDLNITKEEMDYVIPSIYVYKISYAGFRNSTIHGYYIKPKQGFNNVGMVTFHGYESNKYVRLHNVLPFVNMGVEVLMVDIRGQSMVSYDENVYKNGSGTGHMLKGILDPDDYYYSYVYMDACRAVEVVRNLSLVDKVVVEGVSQGGGISIAVSALNNNIGLLLADVPFMSHFARSVIKSTEGPYTEIYQYFRSMDQQHDTHEKVYRTLSYVDVMNFADKVLARALMSVGLEDTICPPSSIFAIYNHMKCAKDIKVYPEYAHGGFTDQLDYKLKALERYINS